MYKFDYATVYYIILQNERECKFLPFDYHYIERKDSAFIAISQQICSLPG